MTRPQVIRADTIDLQDKKAPSAKDHSRQPTHPAAIGAGPPAPHQAEALREYAAEEELYQGQSASWANGTQGQGMNHNAVSQQSQNGGYHHQQDGIVVQNGGISGPSPEDAELADAEGDDSMDEDDMMDKISSSPSIDDGGYSPTKSRSFPNGSSPAVGTLAGRPANRLSGISSFSSPYVDQPEHFPLGCQSPVQRRRLPRPPSPVRVSTLTRSVTQESIYSVYTVEGGLTEEDLDDEWPAPQSTHVHQDSSQDDTKTAQSNDAKSAIVYEWNDDDSKASDSDDDSDSSWERQEESEDDSDYGPSYYDSDDDIFGSELSTQDPLLIDTGWSGECLQDIEDIDFEFVYALHTFVATVEGQANATKGDTMVLLDDSNSYWWLVRVVKDSSIGYLPAEHIETPDERLARLNKHRNIDLSATMLGDQSDKPKASIMNAIRRKTKNVTFNSTHTYVEASDVEYSSDEEGMESNYYAFEQENAEAQKVESNEDEISPADGVSVRSNVSGLKPQPSIESLSDAESATNNVTQAGRQSEDSFETQNEAVSRSRNGTVRNTDSFFKDDTVETRKITITPNILRDDSSTSTRTSNDSKETRSRGSLDRAEKDAHDKHKDKKGSKDKGKDKKPGMLSGLFKRKEKKPKANLEEEDPDELVLGKKASSERTASPARESEEIVEMDEVRPLARNASPQRQTSKLQKQRSDASVSKLTRTASDAKLRQQEKSALADRPHTADGTRGPSMRLVQPDTQASVTISASKQERSASPSKSSHIRMVQEPAAFTNPFADTSAVRGPSRPNHARADSDVRPEVVMQASQRLPLDDSETSGDEDMPTPTTTPSVKEAPLRPPQRPVPGAFPDSYASAPETAAQRQSDEPAAEKDTSRERLSESPVHVTNIPGLMGDNSSQEEASSPMSSPSPELIEDPDAHKKTSELSTSTTPTSTSTWSDAHLRSFFDDGADIRDLLVVVYDNTGVQPAGPDHPITGNMFKAENAKLADITNRLDNMLGDWLARKRTVPISRSINEVPRI